jgi:adenylate kinase family enzyme
MDQLNWQPGWVESSKDDIREKLAAITATESWIIDGTYGGTLAPRLERADTVLYLDYPIRLCIARLLKRIWTWRGKARPDMTEDCPERFELGFFLYVLRWNSGPKHRLEAALNGHEAKVIRFHDTIQLKRWLDSQSA